MPTKAEKETYRKIAELGCSLCRHLGSEGTPAELHHIRRNNIPRSQAPVIALCPYHHRGSNTSIHGMGRKRFEREYGVSEEQLLEQTLELIGDCT
jgi:hypothetical protein